MRSDGYNLLMLVLESLIQHPHLGSINIRDHYSSSFLLRGRVPYCSNGCAPKRQWCVNHSASIRPHLQQVRALVEILNLPVLGVIYLEVTRLHAKLE